MGRTEFIGLPQSSARKASREMITGVKNSGSRWLYRQMLDENVASDVFASTLRTQTSDASKNPYHQLLATQYIKIPGGGHGPGLGALLNGIGDDDFDADMANYLSSKDSFTVRPTVPPSSNDTDWSGVLKSFATSIGSGFGFRLAGGQLPTKAPPPSSFPVGKALVIGGAIAIPLIYLMTRRS